VNDLRIDGGHLLARLEELGTVGRREDGSCCRLALTDEDRQGRDLVVSWMRELGLQVQVDRIGNLIALRPGAEDLAPVMTGSHIDTVATGGKYDGNYGVLAGLEAMRALDRAGIRTRRPLAVAVFTNEEGARFQLDMLGSLVYAGGLELERALALRATDGPALGAELERIGYNGTLAPGAIVPHAFVELHIEQGPVLDREGGDLGAVHTLQGISWTEVTLRGVANHAGTTPMALRHDAGYGAARTACFVRELTRELGGDQVGTVGSLRFAPGLVNVIPREAVLTVDLRNPDEDLLCKAERRLDAFLDRLAGEEGLEIATRRLARSGPVTFDPGVVRAIEAAAGSLGRKARPMVSGAGQDAQMLARICPAAMIFVPSIGGISHSPAERTGPGHLELGANVLLRTLLALAECVRPLPG
jgi:N-carbamoyl-L-amino-acid hydrolase